MERKSGIVVACLVFVGGGLLARTIVVGGVTFNYWSERPGQVAIGASAVLAALITVLLVRRRRALAERKLRFEAATRDTASTLSSDGEAAWTTGVGARQALSRPGAGIPTPVPDQGAPSVPEPTPEAEPLGQPLPPPSL